MQNKHPIAFFSKTLSPSMKRQSTYTRELYAITEAIAKFRHYLLGRKFIIRTDHQSLMALLEQNLHTPYQYKWLHKLLGYDLEIHYKPGNENVPADALSRSYFAAWSTPNLDWLQILKTDLEHDEKLKMVLHQCQEGNQGVTHYNCRNGILLWKNRVVIPRNNSLISLVLQEYHDSSSGGHFGVAKTVERICSNFYWPDMQKHIREYVLNCSICQKAKSETKLPAGLLQPLSVPSQIWKAICMDFFTSLPLSQGFSVIMVIIDRLTKFAHFLPLKHDFTSKSVAEVFVKNVIKLHGFPRIIVSDRDKVFISKFWQQLFRLQGTILVMSSTYHPETDGQSEVLNKTLEMYLRCLCYDNPKNWTTMLPWAQYWYNTTWRSNIKMTPYKALYGRDPPTLIKYEVSDQAEVSLQEILVARDKLLD